ncbi:MAG TPA: hypothetical protein VJ725_10180 [Thermoanaerobaculia bacterium]|nr:hypothetical protein [Thermoanaerobaculia bacterium]
MQAPEQSLILDHEQAIARLSELIGKFPADSAKLTDEEQYGMFALFGARGSGKSTVLKHVLKEIANRKNGVLVCTTPLDCTTLARHIPLGLSLVAHVKRCVEGKKGECTNRAPNAQPIDEDEVWRNFQKLWEKLVESYVATDPHHRDLQLSLAVTQSEYQSIAAKEMESRAVISQKVGDWLGSALSLFGQLTSSKKDCILVALEDSDLGTGPVSLRVVATFLDELADKRLMFVVVADEHNLEERFKKGTAKELPPQMISQVLAKVIPVHHRVYLDPWDPKKILSFIPLTGESKDELKVLLNKALVVDNVPLQVRDLLLLLPRYPRGLSDFYRGLEQLVTSSPQERELPQQVPAEAPVTGSVSPKLSANATSNVILMLARARGDLSLARNLPRRPLSWWGLHLRWPKEVSETWDQLMDRVWAERPLWAFAPTSLPFELDGEEDAVLWAELLLNVSFRFNRDAIRHFIRRFTPLQNQLASCSFRFKPTAYELVRLGQMPQSILSSPWFLWHGTRRDSAEIETGWAPIVERSIGQPRSGLAEILKDLGVAATVESSTTAVDPGKDGILPKDVRSLLLLADSVSQLPWGEMLAWAEAQFLQCWPPLLALFCSEAYLITLYECLYPESLREEDSPPPGIDAIDWARNRAIELAREALQDSSANQGAENLETLIREIDQIDWNSFDHPMAEATQSFFRSTAVRDLLRPEFRKP